MQSTKKIMQKEYPTSRNGTSTKHFHAITILNQINGALGPMNEACTNLSTMADH